jgi:multidrug efflux pump
MFSRERESLLLIRLKGDNKMNFSRFFVDRPVFAGVLSVLIFVAGLIGMTG